jgi:hypothetical protein
VLDDLSDVQPMLRNLVKAGTIVPTANSYVAIHFMPKVQITTGSDVSCNTYCAFHSTVDISDLSKIGFL